ncbi:hypothetical protein ALNOE001_06660 [Candidatus Methanobinarius endosymbioticus]|uniref:Uncharacterized protein n=1 Tax=Candidatus Methanobinarius endosymbioticus TaxID=2006182 RepID=A0A366MCJ1_9EURY|nr:hypothetical protein ALNOE001_06660 [Candidatus Methanobinarius endosymbioticus]
MLIDLAGVKIVQKTITLILMIIGLFLLVSSANAADIVIGNTTDEGIKGKYC